MMQAVIFIYYVSEARSGFAFIEQGFWGFALKFVFMNLPWLFSPMILIPLIPKMLPTYTPRTLWWTPAC
jgi:hypothetical protein